MATEIIRYTIPSGGEAAFVKACEEAGRSLASSPVCSGYEHGHAEQV